jgi:hypothetical protein
VREVKKSKNDGELYTSLGKETKSWVSTCASKNWNTKHQISACHPGRVVQMPWDQRNEVSEIRFSTIQKLDRILDSWGIDSQKTLLSILLTKSCSSCHFSTRIISGFPCFERVGKEVIQREVSLEIVHLSQTEESQPRE